MKLLRCDGRLLEVRDVGPVIFRLAATAVPLKLHGWRLMEDAEARELIRSLKEAGGVA
jgi:hypothetical protein